MKWTLVAFDHPKKGKSVLYRQDLDGIQGLLEAVYDAVAKGTNLISIRGFEE